MTLDATFRRILLDPNIRDIRGAALTALPPVLTSIDAATISALHHKLLHVASSVTDPVIAARATLAAAAVYSTISADRFQPATVNRSIRATYTPKGDWTDFFLGSREQELAKKAAEQIALAKSGSRVNDQRVAGWSTMTHTAEDVPQAQMIVAYWMAVASRVSGVTGLANAADTLLAKARSDAAASSHLFRNTDPTGVARTYQQGVVKINGAIGNSANDRSIRGIVAILGAKTPDSVAVAQQAKKDQSIPGFVVGAVQGTAADIATGLDTTRGLVTGEKPSGMSDVEWFFRKWGLRIGLGVLAFGAILWLGRPYVKAIQAAPPPRDYR